MAIKLECDRCRSQETLTLPVLHDDNKERMKPNLIVKHQHATDLEFWLCNRCKNEVVNDIKIYRRGASSDTVDANNENHG